MHSGLFRRIKRSQLYQRKRRNYELEAFNIASKWFKINLIKRRMSVKFRTRRKASGACNFSIKLDSPNLIGIFFFRKKRRRQDK